MKHIPELDGLRGIAVCLVIAHHYVYFKYLSIFGPRWGWIGVDFFFVLSGFLITGILLRCYDKQQGLGNFYMRRIFRLFPLYYVCLAVYLTANAILGNPLPWRFIASHALYIQAIFPHSWLGISDVTPITWTNPGFSVLWSLSIEEFFYLVWAPLVFISGARERILLPLLTSILVSAPFVRFFAYSDHAQELRQMFFARADALAAGALVAVCMKSHSSEFLRFCRQRYLAILSISGFLLLAFLVGDIVYAYFYPDYTGDIPERLYSSIVYTLLWIAFSLILILAVSNAGSSRCLPSLLRNGALRYMGRISYCAYLIHFPLRHLFVAHFGRAAGLTLGIVATIAIASLSWRLFEGPIARWKERCFSYQGEPFSASSGHLKKGN